MDLSLHSRHISFFQVLNKAKSTDETPMLDLNLLNDCVSIAPPMNHLESFTQFIQERKKKPTSEKAFGDITQDEVQQTFNHLNILGRASQQQLVNLNPAAHHTMKVSPIALSLALDASLFVVM